MTKEIESTVKQSSELTQIELDQPATPSHQRASPIPQQAPPIQQVQHQQTLPISQLTTPNVAVSYEPRFSAGSQMSSPNRQLPNQPRCLPHYAAAPNQQLQQQQVFIMPPYQVNTAAPIGTQQYHQPQSQALVNHPARMLYSPVTPEACRYRAKSAKTLGILQIITAVMFVIFGVSAILVEQWIAWICIPIWTAIFFYLPAGILGVISAKPTSMQSYVISSCTVMSFFAAIAAVGTGIVMIVSAFNDFHLFRGRGNVVMDTLIALLALGETIIAIMQMIYCCRAPNKCCGTKTFHEGHYTSQVYHTNPCGQRATSVARYPAEVMQQQRSNYHVQSTLPLQAAPLAQWPMHSPNSGEYNQGFLTNPNGNDEDLTQPPKYTDSPPPCYSSLANM